MPHIMPPSFSLIMGRRRGRWPGIDPALGESLVFSSRLSASCFP